MNLTKLAVNEIMDLTKDNAGLKHVALAGSWDLSQGADAFDLDLFAIPLTGGKFTGNENTDVAFFNNLSAHGMTLDGDNRTGDGDGDDETIKIVLADIPATYDEVILGINIYNGPALGQRFGQVQNAMVRLYDVDKGPTSEIARYELRSDFKKFTAVVVGRLIRKGAEWEFETLAKGLDGSIADVITALYK